MPSLTLSVAFGTQKHRFLLDALRSRVEFSKKRMADTHKNWREAEEKALAYLPERDADAKRRVQREGGKPQYTTLAIPYSYGMLMAAHTYWTTVFLSRTPILQYAGRHGEGEQQVQAVEAVVDYQVHNGQMLVPWYTWVYDVGKYGAGILGLHWEDRHEIITEIVEVPRTVFGIPTPGSEKRKITRRVRGYSGNRVYNVRPYDFLPDPRVPLARFQEGEFCATYTELGWNEVLRRKAQGFYMNIEQLRRHRAARAREAGASSLEMPTEDELPDTIPPKNAREDLKGAEVTGLYEVYVELIPSEWKLGNSDFPEKWVFTVDSAFIVLIGAQPLGAIHNKFPFLVQELEPEGYGLTSRGIPKINQDIQHVIDWLVNSHFYNVRKALNDQFIVDPSRVVMQDLLDPLPGGIIRLKPAAYGTDPKTVMTQLAVVDVTSTHLRDTQFMIEMAQRALGINDQIMGLQTGGGGRKTAQEVRTSASFGINRLKTSSEFMSAMGWAPMSQMIVQNTQQYYDLERKFRIVGDLAITAGPQFLDVTPEGIQGFFDFVPVDGTLPIDRFAQANLWRELFAQMKQFPELMAQYDMGKIFAWVAQLAGLKNINQFRVEVQPDAQIAAQAQQGNIVPLGRSDMTRVGEPGQISGQGTTG